VLYQGNVIEVMLVADGMFMSPLTAFGLLAVSLMLAFYAFEDRSSHFVLAFAGACAMGSAYGFLQGAWPFGLVEGIWTVVAIQKWRRLRRADDQSGQKGQKGSDG